MEWPIGRAWTGWSGALPAKEPLHNDLYRQDDNQRQSSTDPHTAADPVIRAMVFCPPMNRSDSFPLTIEPIARAIHSEYLALVASDLWKGPSAVSWEELSEEFREANRDQARAIVEKLRVLGLGIAPKTSGTESEPIVFSDEQVDRLARMEHERWVTEKVRNGWVQGRVRDNARRVHPDLVPWEALDEPAREKDRNAVRVIPKVLGDAGFAIRPPE